MIREKQMEEARVTQMRELQARHSAELSASEGRLEVLEKRMKAEIAQLKGDHAAQESELRNANEAMRKASESALAKVEMETRELKARLTKELSEARSEAADAKKVRR